MDLVFEERVRLAAFDALKQAQLRHGEVLAVDEIPSVTVDGARVATFLLARGIHKPAVLDAALAVNTVAPNAGAPPPYEDEFATDGTFTYAYRDARTSSRRALVGAESDNAAVRAAMRHALPIIYWFGVVPGRYRPFYPTYVVRDDPAARAFSLDLTELGVRPVAELASDAPSREYRTVAVRARMHQARFREAVLRAYQSSCAVCRLRLPKLVEAAHIVGDAAGGPPVVPNGLALCKIHHAAFDAHILGVRPDLTVAVNEDVLHQVDGPMLRHGIQEFHGQRLYVIPRALADRPADEFVEARWADFEAAG